MGGLLRRLPAETEEARQAGTNGASGGLGSWGGRLGGSGCLFLRAVRGGQKHQPALRLLELLKVDRFFDLPLMPARHLGGTVCLEHGAHHPGTPSGVRELHMPLFLVDVAVHQ